MTIDQQTLEHIVYDVCNTMLGLHLAETTELEGVHWELMASVRIHGESEARVEIWVNRKLAEVITSAMFSIGQDDIPPEALEDAIGEVANMIGGNVKGILGDDSTLSLPEVVSCESLAAETFHSTSDILESGFTDGGRTLVVRYACQSSTCLPTSQQS